MADLGESYSFTGLAESMFTTNSASNTQSKSFTANYPPNKAMSSSPIQSKSLYSVELPVDPSLVRAGVDFGIHGEKSGTLSVSTEQWS